MSLSTLAQLGTGELAHYPELSALRDLARAGFSLAPLRILREDAEEQFYRLNNLPQRLSALFADLDLTDPDEDDLEERAPGAQRLVREHFLLDEVVDLLYAGLEGLPSSVRVRRLNEPGATFPGRVARRGRPTLLALKDTWTEDWSFAALWERTRTHASIALAARPLLLSASGLEDAGEAQAARASSLLGQKVRLLHDPEVGLTGVRFVL